MTPSEGTEDTETALPGCQLAQVQTARCMWLEAGTALTCCQRCAAHQHKRCAPVTTNGTAVLAANYHTGTFETPKEDNH